MGFELERRAGDLYLLDRENDVEMVKTVSGRAEFAQYCFLIKGEKFFASVHKNIKNSEKCWDIGNIDYPEHFSGDKDRILQIIKQCFNAYNELVYGAANVPKVVMCFEKK